MSRIVYRVLVYLALPFFVLFALTRPKIRKSLKERLLPQKIPADLSGAIWIHAASVGEAVIAENMVNYMESRKGEERFLITTNTYYTRDLLRVRLAGRCRIYSLPFDVPFSLKRFVGETHFKALIIVETEIWPNLIWLAGRMGIPVIIVNGRISDSTVRWYRRFAFFMKDVLSSVDLVLAQSGEHRERFVAIGMDASKVIDAGNLKYFREMRGDEGTPAKGGVITFGSVKEKEIEIIVPVIRRLKEAFPGHLIFVAPRELHLIRLLEEQFEESFDVMRYSVYRELPEATPAIVIVDTVGDLAGLYGRSAVAFVGGSLAPYGGQNMLEPLFFGTPVVFGPSVENFREIAAEIVERGAGVMVATGEELFVKMSAILTDEALRGRMGHEGLNIVMRQRQVMERVVEAITEVVWKHSQSL